MTKHAVHSPIRVYRDAYCPIVPDETVEALERYVYHLIPTGSFLMAVLCNDLKEACGRADSNNRRILFETMSLIYNTIPSISWGSYAKVGNWLNQERNEHKEAL